MTHEDDVITVVKSVSAAGVCAYIYLHHVTCGRFF